MLIPSENPLSTPISLDVYRERSLCFKLIVSIRQKMNLLGALFANAPSREVQEMLIVPTLSLSMAFFYLKLQLGFVCRQGVIDFVSPVSLREIDECVSIENLSLSRLLLKAALIRLEEVERVLSR